MGKYIKSFEYHDDYLDFRNSSGFSYPNVSYCQDENEIHYIPLPHFVKLYDNNNMLYSIPIYNVYGEWYTNTGSVQTYYYSCQCFLGDFYLYTETSGVSYQSISVDFYEGVNSISSITCTDDNDSSFTAFSFSMDGNILWIDLNNEYNGGLQFTINYVNNDGINCNIIVNVNRVYIEPGWA